MGNIYEKIKAASALKANAALISGAADAAPTYQDLSTKGGKKPVKSKPVDTNEEAKDDTSVDDVVNTDENNENIVDGAADAAPAKIISALKYGRTPAKNVKDEIKKSMGKGFVGDTFGDVTETTRTSEGEVGDFDKTWDKEAAGGLDYADWIKLDGNKEKEDKFIDSITKPGKETKTYDVTPNVEEATTTTPGEKSNYNMGWAESVNAKWAEGVQRRDAKQDLRQYNKELKRFDKGGLFSKKGNKMINPATGKPFTSATEYADFKMGKSGDRGADGNMDATQEFNQKIGTRRGRDKAPETKTTSETEKYDETKHGKREDITYKDSEVTKTAEVVDDNPPTKFTLRKKSKALKNFKYKK